MNEKTESTILADIYPNMRNLSHIVCVTDINDTLNHVAYQG